MKTLSVARLTVLLVLALAAIFSLTPADSTYAGIATFLQQSSGGAVLVAQAGPVAPTQTRTGEKNAGEMDLTEAEQPEEPRAVPPEPAPRTGAVQPPGLSGGPVSFYFEDADVFDVIQTVFGDILKANYVIDQRVKGKVTFRTVNPIPREEVLPVIATVLRLNGIGFVEEKGLYRILPITDVPNELVYAQMGKLPANVAIEMFTFKNLNIKDSMSEIENAVGLSTQLGRVNIIPIYRLNAILAVSSHKADLEYVRRWVKEFDTMFANAKPKIMVYPLQNSKAKHVAEMLQSIFSGGSGGGGVSSSKSSPLTPKTTTGTPTTRSPAVPAQTTTAQTTGPAATVTGTGFLVSPETKIFADEISNSLVILAIPTDYDFIRDTIKKIDTVPRQVAIEGLLVRVDITDNLDFGMQWAIQNNLKIKGFTKKDINISGPLTLSTPLSDPLQNPAMFQFTAFDAAGNIKLALQSLATVGKAKILASPHILVADNREARIQVGQQIPIATSTTTTPLASSTTTGTETTTTNTSTSTIQYKDIGIILKVKPQINDSGLVSLEVSQEVSSQGADVNIAGQAFTSINKTEATTNLVAKDGETIIIGGLIREDTSNSRSGIPFLSRIPVLGYLFGSTKDDTTRAELIILLTPHVVKNMEEAGTVTSDYVEKYKGVTKDKQIDQFIKERSQKEKSGEDKNREGLDMGSRDLAPTANNEVNTFVNQYVRAYEAGDIEKFMSLYSTSAVENNRLFYDDIRRAYQRSFRDNHFKYRLKDVQMRRSDDHIILTGIYSVRGAKGTELARGIIKWTLAREGGLLKIIRVDY